MTKFYQNFSNSAGYLDEEGGSHDLENDVENDIKDQRQSSNLTSYKPVTRRRSTRGRVVEAKPPPVVELEVRCEHHVHCTFHTRTTALFISSLFLSALTDGRVTLEPPSLAALFAVLFCR